YHHLFSLLQLLLTAPTLPSLLYFSAPLGCLHSVPTRRSSDLSTSSSTRRASSPSPASPTTTRSSWLSTSIRKPARTICWSSTRTDRKSTRLNSSHVKISYAVFCVKKKRKFLEQSILLVPANTG